MGRSFDLEVRAGVSNGFKGSLKGEKKEKLTTSGLCHEMTQNVKRPPELDLSSSMGMLQGGKEFDDSAVSGDDETGG